VAKTAAAEGNSVSVFLAGDAARLIRNAVLDSLAGLGTAKLRELCDAVTAAGGKFYLSGLLSKARGMVQEDLAGKPAEFALPQVLIRHSQEYEPSSGREDRSW